jgi:hypothetical protein
MTHTHTNDTSLQAELLVISRVYHEICQTLNLGAQCFFQIFKHLFLLSVYKNNAY